MPEIEIDKFIEIFREEFHTKVTVRQFLNNYDVMTIFDKAAISAIIKYSKVLDVNIE